MPVADSPVTDTSTSGVDRAHEAPVAVRVEHVHVRYKVFEEQFFSARNLVSNGFRGRKSIEVHAVNDVSFDIAVGEAVGIVGSNGSGKSTLLRAIAGLQSLAAGRIQVRGDAHLLGVNAALKPTLSGFRNVMLGGLAIGMDRDEISAQMDDIVEFSGLGDAMGRPMNTYSSGMRARLAFSIATLRIPEILLIDEALAVGDRQFRRRSLKRINEIRDQAGTVIMVTHNLNEIRATCSRVIWLNQGALHADGDAETVLTSYEDSELP